MADDWLEIAVEVAGIDSELVADALRPHCPGGVAIEPALRPLPDGESYLIDGDGPATVKGYLPAGGSKRLRRSLRLALRFAPLQRPPRWRRARRLPEAAWRDGWKRYFGVLRVGRRLVVKPSWAKYAPRDGDIVIEIDPGLAFGTGQHPTTAMCLRSLEGLVRPGMRTLDLGTGSGILAIAAARLGADRVLALDIDPQAVRAARQNVANSGLSELIEVREGTLDEEGGSPFDLIAANISGETIERLAPAFARSLNAAGRLVVSGFLDESAEGLARAFESAGLGVDQVLAEGDWRAIVARNPPPEDA